MEWARFLHDLWSSDPVGVRTVLDACCGTGLMDVELLELGYDVVGFDASAAMLQRADQRLGGKVPLHCQALPGISIPGTFDAVISTFDGLNYLTPADLAAALDALGARLRPGGWLVFDLHTDAMMELAAANDRITGEWREASYVVTYDVDRAARTCTARIELRDADAEFAESHAQYIHSDADVALALQQAGFTGVGRFHEYTHEPAGPATLRATWIARH